MAMKESTGAGEKISPGMVLSTEEQILNKGDPLPIGAPALMMSPQAVNLGMNKAEILEKRDDKYSMWSDALKVSRMELPEPEWPNPQADYLKLHGKSFKIEVENSEMKTREGVTNDFSLKSMVMNKKERTT